MVFDYKTIKMMISKKIPIIEINLGENIKGLYYSDHIIINKDLDDIQKACTLLEEYGHHKTTVGNILEQDTLENQKQERQARDWAIKHSIRLSDLQEIIARHDIETRYQAATELQVTEAFLDDAVAYFRRKFGLFENKEPRL